MRQSSREMVTFRANTDTFYWLNEPLHLSGAAGNEQNGCKKAGTGRKGLNVTCRGQHWNHLTHILSSPPLSSQIPLYHPSAPFYSLPHQKAPVQQRITITSSTSTPAVSAQEYPGCSQQQRDGGHQLLIDPPADDSPDSLIPSPPFCFWSSCRCAQWWTLLTIHKTPKKHQTKNTGKGWLSSPCQSLWRWNVRLPAHTWDVSEQAVSRITRGMESSPSSYGFCRRTRKNRNRGRRQREKVTWCPLM